MKKEHDNNEQVQAIQRKLETYIGVKARYFEIKVELREEYVRKVAGEDPAAHEELKTLVRQRDNYQKAFVTFTINDEEYTTYIGKLGEIVNRELRKISNDFTEYEKAYNERDRIYHFYMKDQQSESLQQFRFELLKHLAGSIVVKEHRQRYQKEQFDRFLASNFCNQL